MPTRWYDERTDPDENRRVDAKHHKQNNKMHTMRKMAQATVTAVDGNSRPAGGGVQEPLQATMAATIAGHGTWRLAAVLAAIAAIDGGKMPCD